MKPAPSIHPAPKPKPAPPKKPQFGSSIVDRRSHKEKLLAAQRLRSTTPVKKKNAKRAKSEFARCYGSKARVEFVKRQPCVARTVNCDGPIDNAHVIDDGSKGAGRKSGFACIAPLCRRHHHNLHVLGAKSFEIAYNVDLRTAANRTELAWREAENSTQAVG